MPKWLRLANLVGVLPSRAGATPALTGPPATARVRLRLAGLQIYSPSYETNILEHRTLQLTPLSGVSNSHDGPLTPVDPALFDLARPLEAGQRWPRPA